ncbi:MAG: hypothetical protein LBQ31_01980 [Bacteroidales bacterium]|jgi:hypothetical protein|nr:hypothetical protein [Bacteroidales bacterium]
MKIKLIIAIILSYAISLSCVAKEYTHSVGGAFVTEWKYWSKERNQTVSYGGTDQDVFFSFVPNGILNYNKNSTNNISFWWSLIPYYELGVNDMFFFKLEHFCTQRDVWLAPEYGSRNHTIFFYFRWNVLKHIKNKKHQLLLGGILGVNLYVDKLQLQTGTFGADCITTGYSVGYYWHFARNIAAFLSIDQTFGIGLQDKSFGLPFSSRASVGIQYVFHQEAKRVSVD